MNSWTDDKDNDLLRADCDAEGKVGTEQQQSVLIVSQAPSQARPCLTSQQWPGGVPGLSCSPCSSPWGCPVDWSSCCPPWLRSHCSRLLSPMAGHRLNSWGLGPPGSHTTPPPPPPPHWSHYTLLTAHSSLASDVGRLWSQPSLGWRMSAGWGQELADWLWGWSVIFLSGDPLVATVPLSDIWCWRGLNNKSECCQYSVHELQQVMLHTLPLPPPPTVDLLLRRGGRGWGEHAERGEKGYNCWMSWKNLIITQIIWPGVGTGLQTDLSTLVLFLSVLVGLVVAYFTFSSEGRVAGWHGHQAGFSWFMLSISQDVLHFLSSPAPLWPGTTVTVVMGYLMRLTHGSKTGSTKTNGFLSLFKHH